MLKFVEQDHSLGLRVWDNQNDPRARFDKVPILTPAYPSMNSTHNVSQVTLTVLRSEWHRGHDVTTPIRTLSLKEVPPLSFS
jgi:poly(A) polymerase